MTYWYYPQPHNFIMIPIFSLPSIMSQTEQVLPAVNEETANSKSFSQKKSIILNITKEDLLSVGYHRSHKPWTLDQDKKLKELIKSEKMDWKQIGKKLGSRSPKMCYSRYRRLCYESKKRWTQQEEKFILNFINQQGMLWKKMAETLRDRTARQVQQHYEFCLKPNLKKTQWTLEEDLLLIKLLEKYGADWKLIQSEFEGRSEYQIRNRYFGRLLKIIEKKQATKIINVKQQNIQQN